MERFLSAWFVALALALVMPPPAHAADGPGLETAEEELRAALDCPAALDDPAHEPLLLVHGTFTNAWEHWSWNWQPVLTAAGWDVCTVNLPDRSLGDMQLQAEYVVFAVREMAARSGDKVDVLGHSQGAVHPRWAVKWWPDVRASVDDVVMLAGPQHGTSLGAAQSPLGCFASCWQMTPGSHYLNALNAGDETPGAVSYTSVYSLFDELVQPQFPESTSALEGGANVLIQDVCPGRPTEHVFMMADHAVHAVVMDALRNPGPADPARLDPLSACAGAFFDGVDPVTHAADIVRRDMEAGFPGSESTPAEPPLKPYAHGSQGAPPVDPGERDQPVSVAGAHADELVRTGAPTPATGGVPPFAAAVTLMTPTALALLRRRRPAG